MKTITLQDNDGNALIVRDCTPHQIKLSLQLSKEKRERTIGEINPELKILYLKRKRDRHLHYKSNSYGFNYHVLSTGQRFNDIVIIDEFGTFKIPKSHLIEKSKFLFFKQKGFERQIFLPLDEMNKFKI